jgi:hypothetical protein
MRKLVSAAGFQLKGSGWYATDFRNSAKGGKDDKNDKGDKGDGKGATKDEPKGGDEAKPKEETKADASCGAGACPACQ